jgi:AraC family transcriptional regulator, regulatory protein of adaptative response / DNA-3-methyladenine glycosylase II
VTLDGEVCYRALSARDGRFDGVFFVGVTTTGVYCRPVCSARTPRRDRCVFFRSAAEAERDGFRACFRCRPERAPGDARVDAVSRLVRDAVGRIDAGALNQGSVEELARSLGVSARHLRRAMQSELGVSPLELAATRRLALARELLLDTRLGITEVALASGFASVRRFNAAFSERYGRAPSELRRSKAPTREIVTLNLVGRPPYDWPSLRQFLAARSITGIEEVEGDVYARTARVGGRTGFFVLSPGERDATLSLEVSASLAPALMPLVAEVRRAFDLDAHPETIADHLSRDPLLAPLVRRRPGLRIAGGWDPFETVVRALIGQQVSVAAARTLVTRFTRLFGEPLSTAHPALDRLFPAAERVARASAAELDQLGVPRARARALCRAAAAMAEDDTARELERDPARLTELPGIGPWTREYVALRALATPDAFPDGDLVLRRAMGGLAPAECRARAERWRPWRGYAAMHLWTQASEDRHVDKQIALHDLRKPPRSAHRSFSRKRTERAASRR